MFIDPRLPTTRAPAERNVSGDEYVIPSIVPLLWSGEDSFLS